jgi:5-methylthioadenosine/S-adenosylhomocysteine deaminase
VSNCLEISAGKPSPRRVNNARRASTLNASVPTLAPEGMMPQPTVKIDHARFVVTVDQDRRIISDGAVIVEGNRIAHVGKAAELVGIGADRVIDGRQMVVTPGLVNAHLHASYPHAVRGAWPDDIPMAQFSASVYGLMQAMTEQEEYATTLLAVSELVKYGTTSVLDPGTTKHLDACLDAYEQSGIRAIVGQVVLDRPTTMPLRVTSTEEAIEITRRTLRTYDGRAGGRIRAWAMPNSGELCSDELHVAVKRLADEAGVGVTMHQANSDPVVKASLEQYGQRPVHHLDSLGVVGPNVLFSIGIGIDDSEVAIIAERGASVAMIPTGGLKLGLGLTKRARFPEMVEQGVNVCLSTDSANASNLVETSRAMYLAATLFKDARQDTRAITAESAFEMATINGARALGLGDLTGSLEIGKRADLVLWDTRRPEWRNLFNPVNQLVYSADGRSVQTVMVDGRILVDDYKMQLVDEGAMLDAAQAMGEELLRRTGTTLQSKWPVI